MPGHTRKTARGKDKSTVSAPTIDSQELETFRATLPEYRQYEASRFFTACWDIVRALYLIHKYPHELGQIDVAMFAKSYGFFFAEGGVQEGDHPEESRFFSIDSKTVLSDQIDLARPLVIALIAAEDRERPYAALIDGLHRLFKAAWQGIPKLPAYVLTPDEERLCRI